MTNSRFRHCVTALMAFLFRRSNYWRFIKDRHGVTAIEYALIGVAMATMLLLVLGDIQTGFRGEMAHAFREMKNALIEVTTPY